MYLAEYLLRERGISQMQLHESTGISRTSINRVLRGDLPPYDKYQRAFADALNWPQERRGELFEHIEVTR